MFALILLYFISFTTAQVTDCNQNSLFHIQSQDFQPNPPIVGQNATLWIDYQVPDGVTINSGTAKYSVTLNGIPFAPTIDDLCTQIVCPQVPGIYNITSSSIWNGGISGKVVNTIQWYDVNNVELLCSKTTLRV